MKLFSSLDCPPDEIRGLGLSLTRLQELTDGEGQGTIRSYFAGGEKRGEEKESHLVPVGGGADTGGGGGPLSKGEEISIDRSQVMGEERRPITDPKEPSEHGTLVLQRVKLAMQRALLRNSEEGLLLALEDYEEALRDTPLACHREGLLRWGRAEAARQGLAPAPEGSLRGALLRRLRGLV